MLAEWESRELHDDAFDMTYAWTWNTIMHRIKPPVQGRPGATARVLRMERSRLRARLYPHAVCSNHDMNSWVGTEYERFGDGLEVHRCSRSLATAWPLVL